jgi:hypothetical protein
MASIRAKYDKLDEVGMAPGAESHPELLNLVNIALKGKDTKIDPYEMQDVISYIDNNRLRKDPRWQQAWKIGTDMEERDPNGASRNGYTPKFTAVLQALAKNFGEQGVAEDLDADQKRVGQLGPYEKVGPKGAVGKLVGANESRLNEMDSEGYKGHRGDEDKGKGPDKTVKPAKAKDVAKDAEKELTKSMDKAHKKDVKEGQEELESLLKLLGK